MFQAIKIPEKRVSALLGKRGKTKKHLEQSTHTMVKVQREGDVEISGELEGVMVATEIVKAIGRGFPEEKAFLLLNDENQLAVISLQGETEKTIKRLFGRVIGKQGKAKRQIERLTGASLCVFGKTIAVVGSAEAVSRATSAVDDLLGGRKHAYVYAKLEKINRLKEF